MRQDLLIENADIWTLGEAGRIGKGYLAAAAGTITALGAGKPPAAMEAKRRIDAAGRILMPGLVDCHCHLMEYATAEVHRTEGGAQAMAGVANLLLALESGIVAVGEHHLGHPVLAQPIETYRSLARGLPMTVGLAFGCCWLGFEPRVLTSSTRPGTAFGEDVLTDADFEAMALASDFAGENLFLNFTCANAPLAAVPHAGEMTCSAERLRHIIGIFHRNGKKIGAHIEGDESALLFIESGGDVIHHGHRLSPALGGLMAEKGIKLVVTPHAGTSKMPTSPEEAYGFLRQGVAMALASDSFIPRHPEASWIPLPEGRMAGPAEFLAVCQPILRHLVARGVSEAEALRLITVNGRKVLRPDEPDATLSPGRPADMILCSALPGIETGSTEDIRMVIVAGEVQVNRL